MSGSHRVRLTPFAWGGTAVADAAHGHAPAARSGLLVAIAALVAGLLWVWSHALERRSRAPTYPARRHGATPRSDPGLIPNVFGFLPRNRIGAVAAKDIRYFARDPRRARRSSVR